MRVRAPAAPLQPGRPGNPAALRLATAADLPAAGRPARQRSRAAAPWGADCATAPWPRAAGRDRWPGRLEQEPSGAAPGREEPAQLLGGGRRQPLRQDGLVGGEGVADGGGAEVLDGGIGLGDAEDEPAGPALRRRIAAARHNDDALAGRTEAAVQAALVGVVAAADVECGEGVRSGFGRGGKVGG